MKQTRYIAVVARCLSVVLLGIPMREIDTFQPADRLWGVGKGSSVCQFCPTMRRIELPSGRTLILSDTVGYLDLQLIWWLHSGLLEEVPG